MTAPGQLSKTAHEAERHFGKAPGVPNSCLSEHVRTEVTSWALFCSVLPGFPGKTAPYVRSKGRKFEKSRGRRKSRGFKVPLSKAAVLFSFSGVASGFATCNLVPRRRCKQLPTSSHSDNSRETKNEL